MLIAPFMLSALLAVVQALPSSSATPAGAQADSPVSSEGERIFLAAQHALSLATYPRFASYRVSVTFRNGTRTGNYPVRDTWVTNENITNSTVTSRIFSDEDAENPHVPHGIDIGLPILGDLNPEKPNDPMGQVAFAIDQNYGVTPPHTYSVANDVSHFAADAQGLTVIGGSATRARRYTIDLIETVKNATGSSYHLKLTPLLNPKRDRLRELWIATDTMALQAALVDGIGNRAPTNQIMWKVEFTKVDGDTYLSRETALGSLDYGGSGTLHDTVITFTGLQTSPRLPFQYTFGISTQTEPVADP